MLEIWKKRKEQDERKEMYISYYYQLWQGDTRHQVLKIYLTNLQTSTHGLNVITKFNLIESRYYILWDFIQLNSLSRLLTENYIATFSVF